MNTAFLESFDTGPADGTTANRQIGDMEEKQLDVFEAGYAAGWEDATAAQSEQASAATQEFVKSLEDLSFTYNEAKSYVLQCYSPVIEAVFDQLIPQLADLPGETLVVGQIKKLVAAHAPAEVSVRCSPARLKLLQSGLPPASSIPVTLSADPSVDRDEVRMEFSDAIASFDEKILNNGIKDVIAQLSFELSKEQIVEASH